MICNECGAEAPYLLCEDLTDIDNWEYDSDLGVCEHCWNKPRTDPLKVRRDSPQTKPGQDGTEMSSRYPSHRSLHRDNAADTNNPPEADTSHAKLVSVDGGDVCECGHKKKWHMENGMETQCRKPACYMGCEKFKPRREA